MEFGKIFLGHPVHCWWPTIRPPCSYNIVSAISYFLTLLGLRSSLEKYFVTEIRKRKTNSSLSSSHTYCMWVEVETEIKGVTENEWLLLYVKKKEYSNFLSFLSWNLFLPSICAPYMLICSFPIISHTILSTYLFLVYLHHSFTFFLWL